MKQRIRVVIVENEKLQEELKAKMMEDTLKEYTLLNETVIALEIPCTIFDVNICHRLSLGSFLFIVRWSKYPPQTQPLISV